MTSKQRSATMTSKYEYSRTISNSVNVLPGIGLGLDVVFPRHKIIGSPV
jgi:hypothetical protein